MVDWRLVLVRGKKLPTKLFVRSEISPLSLSGAEIGFSERERERERERDSLHHFVAAQLQLMSIKRGVSVIWNFSYWGMQ